MSELDVFETRFAAAYRRYLDNAPRELDAAAVVRFVTAAHPRSRPFAWPGTLRPAQALVWIGLLAALLAAMLATVLFLGSQLERNMPAVVPTVTPTAGPLLACPPGSTPNTPGPVDQARPTRSSPAALAFDRQAGKLVAVVDGVETWTFDVCNNTWTQMHPDQEPRGLDGWETLVYDIDSHVVVAVDRNGGNVWAYDLQADAWTHEGDAPLDTTLVAYDPISGHVVAANNQGDSELWSHDADNDTWTPIYQTNSPDRIRALAYDGSVDRLIGYGTETWLFDLRSGTWSRSAAYTPPVDYGMSAIRMVYDEAAQRTMVIGFGAATYDATADQWQGLDESVRYPNSMVYDSANRRLVGIGRPPDFGTIPGVGVVAGSVAGLDVVALDLLTGEWTVLLEAKSQ